MGGECLRFHSFNTFVEIKIMRPKNSHPRLTERESEIMSLLWEHGPMFVRDMLEHFPDPKPQFNTLPLLCAGLRTRVGWLMRRWATVTGSMLWPKLRISGATR